MTKLQRRPVAGTGALAPISRQAPTHLRSAPDPENAADEAAADSRSPALGEPTAGEAADASGESPGTPESEPARDEQITRDAPLQGQHDRPPLQTDIDADDDTTDALGKDREKKDPKTRAQEPVGRTARAKSKPAARRIAITSDDPVGLWQRVLDASDSARRNSGAWTAYSPNLPENLWEDVNRWLLRAGRASKRRGLAANHVIEVALSRMPRDPDGYIDGEAVAAKAREWLAAHPSPAKRKSTGSRLTIEMANAMVDLSKQLDLLTEETVDKWAAEAAYVQEFLDTFDGVPFPAAAPESV